MITRQATGLSRGVGVVATLTSLLAGLVAVAGCASLTTGTEQTISVVTAPVTNASCTLQNASGSWRIPSTPGSVTIRRAYGDLTIACAAADGASAERTMASTVAPATFANILLMGSVVWAAVDAASGAAFEYPERINVTLKAAAIDVAAAPVASLAAGPAAAAQDPQQRIAELHRQRAEHNISALEYQLRLAEVAASMAKKPAATAATASGAATTALPIVATAATVDAPKGPLEDLRQLRAEHRISAIEYSQRLTDLVERGLASPDLLK